jgi:glycosyltransferase involved in cell wall biosynthesis
MKILVINWRCIKNPEMGGAEVHLHEIFKRVAAAGNDVTLVAHAFNGAPKQEIIDGIKVIRVGNKVLFDVAVKRFYKSKLKNENFDLVVDDISKIPLDTPKFVKEPLVGIIHHIHGESLYRELPYPLAKYIISKENRIPYVYADTPIFTVSPSTRKELIDMGLNSEKIDFLYNAINHELYASTHVEKFPTPTITYIGRIKKYKQIERVINAMPLLLTQFPDLQFRIGGRGDYEETLKKIVAEKGLQKHVKFLGFLSEKEKAEELGKAWVFVTLAMKEGWGITVIEANAMGTPVVGSDVQGLRDSIRDYETGFLVNMDDKVQIAEKIGELLSNDDLRKEFSANAKIWAKKFTWENSAEHFIKKVKEWYPQLNSVR